MCNHSKPYYDALPKALKPESYDLEIKNVDIESGTFSGKVAIKLSVQFETDELHLNYRELEIKKELISAVQKRDGKLRSISIESIEKHQKKEYFVIKFGEVISPEFTNNVIVTLEYTGIIQTNMAGLYRSSYEENGVQKHMLSTQFEATDARRAFPCFDEPELKAVFKVNLEIFKDWVVLGNMPVESETEIGNGLKCVSFQYTPIMSTYLLAWACGDFEYIESFTQDLYADGKPLPVRIYTTKGYKEEAKLASEITPKILDYFSRVFDLQYPLPKLDLIAVHSFSHNAMENWGLITYRSTALLYSESKSDPIYKEKVAYVIAHELAHQWFGNLVTMKWWDELWLNEGFATWVGFNAVDYLFPEWSIFNSFVSDSLESALNLDALRNSHPIEVPVSDALEIDQLFDAISYLKGASTILMLANYLGIDVFLKGVSKYLKENKYGNATSANLWSAITEVSNKPISSLMQTWIKKVGYPIVDVDLTDDKNTLILSQRRFLSEGNLKENENTSTWWVPLNISTGSDKDALFLLDSEQASLKSKTLEINNFIPGKTFFKLNKDTKGVYRVNYLPRVLDNLLLNFDKFSVTDKVGLIADVSSIAASGDQFTSTVTFLNLIKTIKDSDMIGDDYVVWLEIGKRISDIFIAFCASNKELNTGLQNFAKFVYSDISDKVLLQMSSGETSNDFLQIKLRKEILSKSGDFAITGVQDVAMKYFNEWTSGAKLDPSLRSFVFSSIVSSESLLNKEIFDKILSEVVNPTSLDSREVTLGALGHISNMSYADELFNYLINPRLLPTMDCHFLGQSISKNILTKNKFWKFFKDNYETFYSQYASNMVVLDRFIKITLRNYQSLEMLQDITEFFKDKDCHGFERSLTQALDNIKINHEWFSRDKDEVINWLKENDFI